MWSKRGLTLCTIVLSIASCNDGPTEPGPPVNPALVAAMSGIGLSESDRTTLPFAAGEFVGPDGVLLDAVGFEFIQEVEINDVMLRTSGVVIIAVPKEGVEAPYEKLRVSMAHTGALSSVAEGMTIAFEQHHEFDFITPKFVALARVGIPGAEHTEWFRSPVGSGTFVDRSFSNATSECDLRERSNIQFTSCTEQTGTVTMTFDFDATNEDGTESFAQPRITVEVPAIRQSLTAIVGVQSQ